KDGNKDGITKVILKSTRFYWLSHFEIVDIEKVAVHSTLRRSGIENKQVRYSIYTVKRSSRNRRIIRWRYNLIPAESKFKNLMFDHQDKYMMKAQVHVSKSSAISDIQALPRRKHFYQIYQIITSQVVSSGKAHIEGEIVSELSRSRA
nr:hypothetical protein [Tanacetum cinerariifolium]